MTQSTTISNYQRRNTARAAFITAILLGMAASQLLYNGPTGTGWLLWIALLAVGSAAVVRQGRLAWRRDTIVAGGIAVCAAAIPALRASDALHFLSLLALIAAASIPMLRARGLRFGRTPITAQILGMALVPLHSGLGAVPLLAKEHVLALPARRTGRFPVSVLRGALLALPPVAVFAALFISADPLFERYAHFLVRFGSEELLSRLVLAAVFAWIAAGLLRGLLPQSSPMRHLPHMPTMAASEISIVLGSVTALFTLFVLVQARWLFDVTHALEATAGLTVADYARRGFFELVAASSLALPLLIVSNAATRNAAPRARRAIRLLSGSLVVLVLLVMASALQRMMLYTERYGLTEDRLFATAFMTWLAVVFAWFVVTTLRGRRRRFAAGPLTAGVIAVLGLAVLNPDALIARVNLHRAPASESIDVKYLSTLSADAVPELLRHRNRLPAESRCMLSRRLLRDHADAPPARFAASRSELRARELVYDSLPALHQIIQRDCPAVI